MQITRLLSGGNGDSRLAVEIRGRIECPPHGGDRHRKPVAQSGRGLTGPQVLKEIGRSHTANQRRRRYLTSENSLNIGKYIEMMITPTIAPTPIIIRGSMIAVSEAIAASTSSS